MSSHVAIALAVGGVLFAEWVWRTVRDRRRRRAHLPPPEHVVDELFSPSGRFKAVAYLHDEGVFRVQALQLIGEESTRPFWVPVAGPSFADRAALPDVMAETLRVASGEPV